ncbi:unnamed protein product [Callosobruchus maculatus]|uniref:Uncharacterized protein n=1 Tax=Callosobruchus maculatus TaxID=64391 RepID=A0A653CUV2_CALMS|nr:unnamed protein product [Callosobruchus maculatus]
MKFILLLLCMFLVTHRISSMTVKQFNATRNWCGILVKISRKLRVCYIHCILNTYNLLNKDLIFDWEGGIKALKGNAPESIAEPGAVTIENCKDAIKTRNDKCIAAMEVAKCLHDDNPANYFLP